MTAWRVYVAEADKQESTIFINIASTDGCKDAIGVVEYSFSARGYVSYYALRKLRQGIEQCHDASRSVKVLRSRLTQIERLCADVPTLRRLASWGPEV